MINRICMAFLLQIGLIDDIAADKSECIEKCEAFINGFKNIPSFATARTKQMLRMGTVSKLSENLEGDMESFISVLGRPNVQESLGNYFKSLKKNK